MILCISNLTDIVTGLQIRERKKPVKFELLAEFLKLFINLNYQYMCETSVGTFKVCLTVVCSICCMRHFVANLSSTFNVDAALFSQFPTN